MDNAVGVGKALGKACVVAVQGNHIGAGDIAPPDRRRLPPDRVEHPARRHRTGAGDQKTNRAVINFA